MNRIVERMKKLADSPSEWFDHFTDVAFGQVGVIAEIDADIDYQEEEKQTHDYPGSPAIMTAYCNGVVEFEQKELSDLLGFPLNEGNAWSDLVGEVKRRCEAIKNHADFNNIFAYGLEAVLDKDIIDNLDVLVKNTVKLSVSSSKDVLKLSFEYEAGSEYTTIK